MIQVQDGDFFHVVHWEGKQGLTTHLLYPQIHLEGLEFGLIEDMKYTQGVVCP